jgi:hypothetical protein
MISREQDSVANRAKALYTRSLKKKLESESLGKYVAIEPDSGDYFLGDAFGDVIDEARLAHPGKISFVIHIGHLAAIHMGALNH